MADPHLKCTRLAEAIKAFLPSTPPPRRGWARAVREALGMMQA